MSIQEVTEEYRAEAENAESEAARADIREEYSRMLTEVVTDEGMSVQRYNEIYELAQQDEEVRARINAAIGGYQLLEFGCGANRSDGAFPVSPAGAGA